LSELLSHRVDSAIGQNLMPSRPKPLKVGGDGPLLKTWRQEGVSGTRAKVWLSVRRLTAIAIALGLIGWLGYLMLSPLLLPKSYFAYWCTDELQPLVVPPIEYTGEDFAGFTKLENALTPLSAGSKALSYGRLMTPKVLQAELDALKSSAIQSDHPVIVAISAHGIVRDGKAYLICGNFTAAEGNNSLDGLFSVSKLVKQLAEVPGGIKLLLLDATRNDYAPRLGMIENTFADALKEDLSALKLPSVWVFNSTSPGERSHTSPALRRSVFGYMCAAGLQGAADKDNDGQIKLHELTNFVQFNVSNWVKQSTGDTATQTPMLLSAGGVASTGEGDHLLYTTNLPQVEPVSATMSSAGSDDSRSGIVAAIQDFLSDEVDEFGLTPIFTAIGTAKEKLGLNTEDQGESDETEAKLPEEVDKVTQRESQNDVELDLLNEAWRLTLGIPAGPRHPANYAPELWRLHLDNLVWLEYRQQSGERMNQLPLIDELRGLIQSLKNFGKKTTTAVSTKPNVVERMHHAMPNVPVAVSEAPTLGLAEAISVADPNRPLSEKLAAFIKDYDTWLQSSDGLDRLDALKEANWNSAWSQYYELQLLDAFRNDPEVSLEVAKLAFSTRRQSEQTAANLAFGQGWEANLIDEADRLRLEAERLLEDHADKKWLEKATNNLQRAKTLYADAQARHASIQQALQLQNESLVHVRDYLRWCRYCWGDAASRAPSAQRIESLLISVKDLRDALNTASPQSAPNLTDLQRIHDDIERQLAQGVNELASSPYDPGDSERLTALLKTALLNADQRAKCIDARIEADAELMRSFETTPAPSSPIAPRTNSARGALAIEQVKVERMLLDTFSPDAQAQTADWPDLTPGRTGAIVAASEILGNWLFNLNDIITTEAEANSNLSDLSRRTQRFEKLRRAGQGLYLVEATDITTMSATENSVIQQVHNAMWYDLLRSFRGRFVRAQADADDDEIKTLRQLANRCGALASEIPGQPEIANVVAPQLALQVSTPAVELVAVDEATLDFTVQSFGYDGPIWIVAQYDPNAIAITGANWTILSQQDVEDAPVVEASENPGYPYWPLARRNILETMTLATGQSRDLSVKVRRLNNVRGDTTLVLKVIGNKDFIRHRIPVRLPGRQDIEISVAGARAIRRNLESKTGLFANRTQELTIYLANTGSKERSVTASIFAPQQAVKIPIPTGSLESTAAEQILQRIGPKTGVALGGAPFTLAPGSAPQPLHFDFQTPENKMLLGASPKEGPIKLNVPYGLLLDIVDQESREHTIRWLQFEVWRPHVFLKARASYDPGSRRLLVTAEAADPKLCPEGEIELTLEVDKKFVSARGGGTYTTFLKAPNYRGELETTLTGRWPRDLDPLAEDFLPIRVNVDNYPRGFEFRLPKTTTTANLSPTRDKASLRFVSPQPEAAYKAADSIAAQIQVEVPEGFFNAPNSFAEVGIDRNQDRELRDEESVVLRSDRQLELFVKLPTNGGTLAFEPVVKDFNLTLRAAGISDRKVNVLGQLTAGGRVAERSYIPIVLDGEGPELGVIKLLRKGPLLVVDFNPQDLTGVNSVEAAFESPTEVKWEPGKPGGGGQWLVELNTKELTPGEYTVLLRATDAVGNTSDVVSTRWTNNPAEDATSDGATESPHTNGAPQAVKNQVKGRVVYGNKEVTNVEVTLTGPGAPAQPARAGTGGTFDFGLVSPGTYTLKARGLAGGNYHKAEQQITVSDQPKTPVNIEVKVR
jgi:hypothetical protein